MGEPVEAQCPSCSDYFEIEVDMVPRADFDKLEAEVAELKTYKTALVESRPHHEKLLDDLVTAEAKVSALTDEVAELRAELAEGVALMELRANGPTRWTRTVRERGLLEE